MSAAIAPIAGAVIAFALAFHSFQRRSLRLGDEPTLPRYFARRNMYWLGIVIYCTVIALTFYALTAHWLPISPLLDAVGRHFRSGDLSGFVAALDGGLLVSWIVAVAFLILVWVESRFNPLLIARDAVFDMFAIPRKAVDVYNALRSSRMSAVDIETRERVIGLLLTATLDVGDFDKAKESIEYKWARAGLLYSKIQTFAGEPSYQRFFTESSLRWGDICVVFNECSEKLAVWKEQPPHYTKTLALIERLDKLDRWLCRLLACLVVFGSASEKEMWSTVTDLGGNPNRLRLKHTYKYVLTYAAAVAIGVTLGRELSIFLQNNFFPSTSLRHFSFGTFRWILYGLCIYVVPIIAVFGARIIADRTVTTESEQRYYGFYTLMMLVGFLLSTSMSALVLGLAGTIVPGTGFDFTDSFIASLRWGILPALLCGYAAFQMDTPVSEEESKEHMYLFAFARFVAWAAIALVIMLYATDGLEPVDLRFSIVLTTVFLLASLGAVTRFKTVRGAVDGPGLATASAG